MTVMCVPKPNEESSVSPRYLRDLDTGKRRSDLMIVKVDMA